MSLGPKDVARTHRCTSLPDLIEDDAEFELKPLRSWIMRLPVLMALLVIATPAAQVEKEWLGATGQRSSKA
jgi:hypothetical protein